MTIPSASRAATQDTSTVMATFIFTHYPNSLSHPMGEGRGEGFASRDFYTLHSPRRRRGRIRRRGFQRRCRARAGALARHLQFLANFDAVAPQIVGGANRSHSRAVLSSDGAERVARFHGIHLLAGAGVSGSWASRGRRG